MYNFSGVEMLQFVHVIWRLIDNDVQALKFGCGFMVLCVPKNVLDFVHLLAYLQFGGDLGFVRSVSIELSAVLRSDLCLLSH